ncbi:MAG: hypothetical protein Q7S88_03805 [Candidatus Daviesbacteria bacterium]|nr:hypothetical protein [Candidatus Daviesbacteria bacterium]
MAQQVLEVKIASPKGIIYQGQALAVSSKNSQGNFDILPLHANFITLIKEVPLVVLDTNKKKQTFNPKLAIIYVGDNKVNIYTEIDSLQIPK